jgi:hypothetical protein
VVQRLGDKARPRGPQAPRNAPIKGRKPGAGSARKRPGLLPAVCERDPEAWPRARPPEYSLHPAGRDQRLAWAGLVSPGQNAALFPSHSKRGWAKERVRKRPGRHGGKAPRSGSVHPFKNLWRKKFEYCYREEMQIGSRSFSFHQRKFLHGRRP